MPLAHGSACVLWVVFCVTACGEVVDEESPSASGDLSVLTYNIGNSVDEPGPYERRIRHRAFEEFVGEQIRSTGANIVALQEVLSPAECARFSETQRDLTCFAVDGTEPPVRRLLGPDYTIVCDARLQTNCIGVHVDFGRMEGVELGGLRLDAAETPPLPGNPCEGNECSEESCSPSSSVSAVTVVSDSLPAMRVVNVHPSAFATSCRGVQVQQAFELAQAPDALLAGDWNFDPSEDDEPARDVWDQYVGDDKQFENHAPEREVTDVLSGDISEEELTPTHESGAIDLVVSSFADGVCDVVDDPPLDEGFDFEGQGMESEAERRPDHFAVFCELSAR